MEYKKVELIETESLMEVGEMERYWLKGANFHLQEECSEDVMHSMATIGNNTLLYICLKVAGSNCHLKYSQRTHTCAHTYRKLCDVIDVLTNLIMVIIL